MLCCLSLETNSKIFYWQRGVQWSLTEIYSKFKQTHRESSAGTNAGLLFRFRRVIDGQLDKASWWDPSVRVTSCSDTQPGLRKGPSSTAPPVFLCWTGTNAGVSWCQTSSRGSRHRGLGKSWHWHWTAWRWSRYLLVQCWSAYVDMTHSRCICE